MGVRRNVFVVVALMAACAVAQAQYMELAPMAGSGVPIQEGEDNSRMRFAEADAGASGPAAVEADASGASGASGASAAAEPAAATGLDAGDAAEAAINEAQVQIAAASAAAARRRAAAARRNATASLNATAATGGSGEGEGSEVQPDELAQSLYKQRMMRAKLLRKEEELRLRLLAAMSEGVDEMTSAAEENAHRMGKKLESVSTKLMEGRSALERVELLKATLGKQRALDKIKMADMAYDVKLARERMQEYNATLRARAEAKFGAVTEAAERAANAMRDWNELRAATNSSLRLARRISAKLLSTVESTDPVGGNQTLVAAATLRARAAMMALRNATRAAHMRARASAAAERRVLKLRRMSEAAMAAAGLRVASLPFSFGTSAAPRGTLLSEDASAPPEIVELAVQAAKAHREAVVAARAAGIRMPRVAKPAATAAPASAEQVAEAEVEKEEAAKEKDEGSE